MVKTIVRARPQPSELPRYAQVDPFLHPYLASRGLAADFDFSFSLRSLPDWRDLRGIDAATELLMRALQKQQRIVIVGDYDADGATSVALMYRGLRAMGASNLHWYVPDRFQLGYGLTPKLVERLSELQPDLIVTVDNGIASIDGAQAASARGYQLLITDHHLPAADLPECAAIVNPNQPGCNFASKNLAGVGVAFYLLLALRARLIQAQHFMFRGEQPPNMAQFLDLVALGTVADLVKLDAVNLILVEQGLRRMRSGKLSSGVRALFSISNRVCKRATSSDLSFALAPRLNAAGRIDDMHLGIKCLLAEDYKQALAHAAELDKLNTQRKRIELEMYAQAEEQLEQDLESLLDDDQQSSSKSICLYSDSYHEGVVGILAGRLKDRTGKPCVVFARGQDGVLKGSARSVDAVHIRDVLEQISNANYGMIARYGGHALAAGLSIEAERFPDFAAAFQSTIEQSFGSQEPARYFLSDGELKPQQLTAANAETVRYCCPWGSGFAEPLFTGKFRILQQRLISGKHLFLSLLADERSFEAVLFNSGKDYHPLSAEEATFVYNLDLNLHRGAFNLRLNLRHIIQDNDDAEYS